MNAASLPPNDLNAERIVLGALMSGANLADVELVSTAFFRPAHQVIFEAIEALAGRRAPTDTVAVVDELRRRRQLTAAGGPPYTHTCLAAVPVAAQAPYYARIVRDMAERRRTIELAERIGQAANDPGESLEDVRALAASARETEPSPDWDDPVPLGEHRLLPTFPNEALPEWVRQMVEGVATETQTPPDMSATIALCALSAAAGGRAIVRVRDGWEEPVNLYLAAVAEPGTRKSAVYRALTAPLYAAERALDEAMTQKRHEMRVLHERREDEDQKARASAIRADPASADEALAAAAEAAAALERVRVPEPVQLITGDVSPEECASILAAQNGRLAIMSAEGRIYDIITGRYSNGEPCLSPFLEGHAGDVLRVNRRGRYESIERPALTIGVCIQPAVLAWIASRPRLRGQGMLARWLYAVPADLVGYRSSEPPPVAASVRDCYASNLKALVLSLAKWDDDPQILVLDDTARKGVVEYLDLIEPRLRPDGDLHGIRDWAAKLAGAVVRIAGLLHLAEHLQDGYAKPVSHDTVTEAIQIGDYYTSHALAAFGVMSADPNLGLARAMLGWLYPDSKARDPFSQRDAHRRFRERDGRSTTADEITAALRLLAIHGYIRPLPPPAGSPRGGRPASPRFEVCPSAPDTTDGTPKVSSDLR